MYRYIATDVDGTMLNSRHQLNSAALNTALGQLQQQNVSWIVASGDSYRFLKKCFAPCPLIDTFISINGALIVQKGQVVFERTHAKSQVNELIKAVNALPVTPDVILLTGWNHTWGTRISDLKAWPFGINIDFIDDLTQVDDKIYNVNPIWLNHQVTPDQIRGFAQQMIERYPVYATYSGFGCMDVLPLGVNKAAGLKELIINDDHDQLKSVVAFGDSSNDRQMLQEAGLGVAMKNASPDILKLANRITSYDNDHDGVLREVQSIFNLS